MSDAKPSPIESAEILAVGTELLLGEIVDTNGATIAARLAQHGVDVYWSLRVGDNLARIVDALRQGINRSDMIITCGGLGPTDDDMTREAIAALAGETPEVDPALEAELRGYFARSGRSMPERNIKQAWTIPSCTPLANPNGTAPGWLVRLEVEGKPRYIAALPGPPREMLPMLENELMPRLTLPTAHLWSRTWKTANIGESHVAERLGELTLAANPSVATYAKIDGVHIRIAAKAATSSDAEALGSPVAAQVETLLGDHIWGKDDESLASLVISALQETNHRLAVMELASAGQIANALSIADPERKNFVGAVVGWPVVAKDAPTLEGGPEEGRLASAAQHVQEFFATDAAIAVGELRPVDGEGGGIQVDVAVRDASGAEAVTLRLPGRSGPWLRDRVVFLALDLLRRRLRGSR